MLVNNTPAKPLSPHEIVTDATLLVIKGGGPERQIGIISLDDQAILAMVLPDMVAELLAYRTADRLLGVIPKPKEIPKANRLLDQDLSKLSISVRCRAVLRESGVHSLRDLVQASEATIMALPFFNRDILVQLKYALLEYGLRLDMQLPSHLRGTAGQA